MHQQTQISLNFSEIFGNQPEHNKTLNQSPSNRILSQSFSSYNPKNQPHQTHTHPNKSVIETSLTKIPFLHRHKLVHSASEQITKFNRLMLNSFAVKLNKPKVADIDKITKRLTETKSCRKIQCLSSTHCKQQQTIPQQDKPKVKLAKSKSMDAFQKLQPLKVANVFERLHYNSIQNLKKCALKQTKSHLTDKGSPQSKKSKRSSASQKYLKNYIPFYKRLEGQLSRNYQKAQLIKKHPKMVSQLQNMTFTPKLYSSPYKYTVKSRYRNTTRKQYHDVDLVNLMNSSINTQSQTLNRSTEIMDRIEQHFFNKMRLIFVSEQTGEVKVSHQAISLLSEVEFSILTTFIMYVQENTIRADDFDYYLRSYFYNLPTAQKMQLRSHETQSRYKYTQFDQLHKTNLKIAQNSAKKQEKNLTNKAHNTYRRTSDYHLNIQHYT